MVNEQIKFSIDVNDITITYFYREDADIATYLESEIKKRGISYNVFSDTVKELNDCKENRFSIALSPLGETELMIFENEPPFLEETNTPIIKVRLDNINDYCKCSFPNMINDGNGIDDNCYSCNKEVNLYLLEYLKPKAK